MPACTNATLCMFKGLHVANSFVHLMLCSSETNVCQCSELVTMVGKAYKTTSYYHFFIIDWDLLRKRIYPIGVPFSYERSDQWFTSALHINDVIWNWRHDPLGQNSCSPWPRFIYWRHPTQFHVSLSVAVVATACCAQWTGQIRTRATSWILSDIVAILQILLTK
jgi:hypothetical protein